jgi:hypothetical protein
MPEPQPEPAQSGPDPEEVAEAIRALSELTAAGAEVDGELQIAESTWVIYGHINYEGEILVGVYHDGAEAAEVLRAAPGRRPGSEGPVP